MSHLSAASIDEIRHILREGLGRSPELDRLCDQAKRAAELDEIYGYELRPCDFKAIMARARTK